MIFYFVCFIENLEEFYNEDFLKTLTVENEEIEQFVFKDRFDRVFVMNKNRTKTFLLTDKPIQVDDVFYSINPFAEKPSLILGKEGQ